MGVVNTYNNIIDVLRDIANRHYNINTFGVGQNWDIGASETMYPLLWMKPISAKLVASTQLGSYPIKERVIEIRCLDLVNKGEDNLNDVLSDTEQILTDVVNELSQNPYYITSQLGLIGDIDFSPLQEYSDDETSGHVVQLKFRTLNRNTFCGLPMDAVDGDSFPGPDYTGVTYNSSTLTCATLTACTSFQNYITNVITNSATTASNGLTKVGNDIQLGGMLTANTIVDGDSYDITFNRNSNVSINSTGSTTISNNDTITNATLSLGQNVGNIIVNDGSTNNVFTLGVQGNMNFAQNDLDDYSNDRHSQSQQYLFPNFIGQSWLAKTGVTENQLIHTTTQFAVTYDSFARIPFNIRRNNSNGEGILETLPTYTYTGNTNSLNGIVGVNSTGELFNTGYKVSSLTGDTFVTGGTYSNGIATFTNNTGGTFSLSGFYTGATDVRVTGGTYSNGVTTFTNNTGGTFSITGYSTGTTVSGFIPYTGATTSIDLNSQSLTTSGFTNLSATTATSITINTGILSIQRGQNSNVTNLNLNSGTLNTSAFQINTDQPNTRVYVTSRNNYGLALQSNDTTRIYISSGGTVGIGTSNLTPSHTLQVSGNTNIQALTATTVLSTSGVNASFGAGVGYYINTNTFAEQLSASFVVGAGLATFQVAPKAATSGTINNFLLTGPANTNQVAGVETNGFLKTGGSRIWNGGNISIQRENWWASTTYSATSATTITNAYGNYLEAPIASTGITITNNFALGTSGATQVNAGTSSLIIRELVGTPTQIALYANRSTPNSTNHILTSDGNNLFLNTQDASTIYFQSGGGTISYFNYNQMYFGGKPATSGAINNFLISKPNNTNQTAGTEINGWRYLGGTRQWLGGTIPLQRENVWSAITYSFTTASTINNAYANWFEAASAGTNTTITNNFALGTSGATQINDGTLTGGIQLRAIPTATQNGGIWINQTTPSSSNYFLQSTNAQTNIVNGSNGTLLIRCSDSTLLQFNGNATSNSNSNYIFTKPTHTNATASVEVSGFKYNGSSRSWATGNFPLQRENYWASTTYSAAGASIITDAYANYYDSVSASTNITINNNWVAGFEGNVKIKSVGTNKYFEIEGTAGQKARMASDGAGAMFGSVTAVPTRLVVQNGVYTPIVLSTIGDTNIDGKMFVGTATTVPTAYVHINSGTTSTAQIRLNLSTAPSSPNNGDIWFDAATNTLKMQISGVTKTFVMT